MINEKDRENIASLLPVITDFDAPFWTGLENEELLVQVCDDCGNAQFPSSPVCINCLSDNVHWVKCSGKATLWTHVRFHKAYLTPYDDVPYSVGIAKLEEGCLITGRLSNDAYDNVPLDSPVSIEFRKTTHGSVLIELVPV